MVGPVRLKLQLFSILCSTKISIVSKIFFKKCYKYGARDKIRQHAAAEGTWIRWSKFILSEAHIDMKF